MAFDSLLPPNAQPLERLLEEVTLRAGQVEPPGRDIKDPDACPAEALPWLAWEMSVDTWNPDWSESVKRAQVRTAFSVHARKGTVAAVKEAVAAFGAAVSVREWWQETPPAEPHTFKVVLTVQDVGGEPPPDSYIDDIVAKIRRVKPARAHFTFTQGLSARAQVSAVAAARAVSYARIQLAA